MLTFACCGGAAAPKADVPLDLPKTVDLVPAAGLSVLVDAHPREILAHGELLPLVAQVFPEEQFRVFAERHAGVDPRQLEDLEVATYGDTTLVLGRGDFDPVRAERAFHDRSTHVLGRFVDRPGGPVSTALRFEGSALTNDQPPRELRTELVLLGRAVAGYEEHAGAARVGPLRASELFALRKLERARPALAAPPLDTTARALGEAPVRVFFAGPFEGEAAKGLGGLLQAATAVGIAVRPTPRVPAALAITIVLMGAWKNDAAIAGERFAAAVSTILRSDFGRLCGAHEPIRGPDLEVGPDVLTVQVTLDAAHLAAGLRIATAPKIDEIMKD
jgi:hypothetical protein